MDYSSSSRQPQNWEHHVFVSFRGEDVRTSFLSHILKEFKTKGINPFIDNEMKKGTSISPKLKQAIKGSKIAIVLISKNYASSSWCLNELVKILKCRKKIGQKVITIFYQVEPTDVKKQAGNFGKVFEETCKGKTFEMIHKWKEALAEVATIVGYDSSNWVDEAAAIEEISTDISDMLNHMAPTHCLDRLIGMEAHMETMQLLLRLDLDDEVRMIGIWGPLGIGKSTISTYLYNQISNNFQLRELMVNIKQTYPNPCLDEGSAQLKLQNDMLSEVINHKDIKITHLGAVEDRLKDKKVLLVLDDVDRLTQLEALAGDSRWFGSGSRIIIATEDIRVLLAHGIRIDHIYKVNYPSNDEAFQMFCMYAFRRKSPHDGFMELAHEVTYYAGNIPLGLQVMGSYFRGRPKKEWIEALPRLRSHLDGKIENIMKFSYDALSDECKDLFCRIVCYHHFDRVDNLEAYLSESSMDIRHGLRVLAEKSFISFEDGYIIMHKLLAQLGQEIVRKRLFLVGGKDTSEVLTDYTTMTRSVVGIAYTYTQETFNLWSSTSFTEFWDQITTSVVGINYQSREGREGTTIERGFERMLLYPRGCLTSKIRIISKTLSLKREYLVELKRLYSKLEKLWEGTKLFGRLKWMDLSHSRNLKELPDLSTAIKELQLEWCSTLMELADFIRNATNIQKQNLFECSSLEEIPFSIGYANNLQEINLLGCTIGNAINFREINIYGCTSLMKLSCSIAIATNLQNLNLTRCSSLVELPSSIGHAINLQKLNLYGCTSLRELPYSIGKAINLQNLNLTKCSSLVELPYSIGNITNLEKLYLSHCSSLVKLPSSIGNLHKLKRLTLRGCSKLEVLPTNINMEQLDIIDLTDHFVLKNFPDFVQLNRFRRNTRT